MRTPPASSDDSSAVRSGVTGGSWIRRHARVIDLVVVLAVFLYNLPIQWASVPAGLWSGTGIVLSVGLCVPFLFRRRFPLGAFGVMLVFAFVQLLLGVGILWADVMLLFALHHLANRRQWKVSVPGGVVVVGWLLGIGVPLVLQGVLAVGDLGVLIISVAWAWTWGTLVRVRRDYIASLHERAQHLERERDAQAEIVAAQERARIAREIHDIVSHSLSVVVIVADGAASKAHSEPDRAKKAMESVRDTSRTALAEMRRMLGVLRPDEPGSQAPQPGTAQLAELVEQSQAAGLPVNMRVEGVPTDVSAGLGLVVYRVVQEALTNVRKHATPPLNHVEVTLVHRDTDLEIRVTDDGSPEHGTKQDAGTGHGLVGMRERVSAYGGTLRTGTRPSGGYEVVAQLPTGGHA